MEALLQPIDPATIPPRLAEIDSQLARKHRDLDDNSAAQLAATNQEQLRFLQKQESEILAGIDKLTREREKLKRAKRGFDQRQANEAQAEKRAGQDARRTAIRDTADAYGHWLENYTASAIRPYAEGFVEGKQLFAKLYALIDAEPGMSTATLGLVDLQSVISQEVSRLSHLADNFRVPVRVTPPGGNSQLIGDIMPAAEAFTSVRAAIERDITKIAAAQAAHDREHFPDIDG
jgi:hypothetical protein